MNLLDDLKEIYSNDGKIETLNMSTGNQKAIDHLSLKNQNIESEIIKDIQRQTKHN